jgi:hypothetical protein
MHSHVFSRPLQALIKPCIQAVVLLGLVIASASLAHAQGCVPIKQVGSGTSPLDGEDLNSATPDKWEYTLSYEHFRSDKDYTGPYYNGSRQTKGNSIINVVDQFDSGLSYDFNSQNSVALDIPYFAASRSQLESGTTTRFRTYGRGIGDVRLSADRWLVDPATKPKVNLQLGLALSVPTGTSNQKGWFLTTTGPVLKNLDQSIQPGEGGWGYILQGQAYWKLTTATSLYTSGFYMATPQDTNGTRTSTSLTSETSFNSIYDQYLIRGGVNQVIRQFQGGNFSGSLGVRWEGVPSLDLIGRSDGFRRPGYVLSVDPGLAYDLPHDSFSLNVPVPWYRNRTQSYPDSLTGGHGDAFFADFLIVAAYSHRW